MRYCLLWLICIVVNYMILLGYFIFSFFSSSVLRRSSQPSINRNMANSPSGKSRAIMFVELVVVWSNSGVLISTLFFVQLQQELIMLQLILFHSLHPSHKGFIQMLYFNETIIRLHSLSFFLLVAIGSFFTLNSRIIWDDLKR